MSSNLHDKQKSPKRRFLLLNVIRLIAVVTVGLLIMFYNKFDLNLSNVQKMVVGGLFIVYGVLRFTLSLKNQPNE
jgi:undecaprenyl pyrophosphate phosphatase UppP